MKGREALLRKLKAMPPAVRKEMRAALAIAADRIVATQKNLAPKRTGALAASIGYSFGSYTPANANVRGVASGGAGDPDLTVVIHAGDAKAYYAAWVEFGTASHVAGGKFAGARHPGAKASPFFYPGWRAHKRGVKSRLSRAMRKGLKEAVSG